MLAKRNIEHETNSDHGSDDIHSYLATQDPSFGPSSTSRWSEKGGESTEIPDRASLMGLAQAA
jgi:hypothetical protein